MLWLAALGTSIITTAVFSIRSTRPAPPDLGDPATWMLIKKDVHRDVQVRVYAVQRVSTTWDPHDAAQNKIIIRSRLGEHQFRWPSGYDFAGGWSEIFHGHDGSVAVVLFGSENVARVVTFANDRFVFRPKKAELVVDGGLTYTETEHGGLEFELREPEQADTGNVHVWRWTPGSGFSKTVHLLAPANDRR